MGQDLYTLPDELRQALNAELQGGERVLYAGRANWRAETGKLVAIFLFGMFWSSISFVFFGFAVASLLGINPMMTDGHPSSLALQIALLCFSLPFVGIGCAFLAAPFLGIRKSNNTVHAVTDMRLLNVYSGRDAGAESYPLAKINFLKRRDKRDGAGSLNIGYGVERDSDGDPRPLAIDWTGIPNVKHAEAAIRENAKWVR